MCSVCILWKDRVQSNLVGPFHVLSTLHPQMFKDGCVEVVNNPSILNPHIKESTEIENKNMEEVVQELPNSIVFRFLAYWIMTYGFARLVAGIKYYPSSDIIAAITYFLEAFCFEWESRIAGTMSQEKVTFVSYFSFVLGVLVLLRPTGVYGDPQKTCLAYIIAFLKYSFHKYILTPFPIPISNTSSDSSRFISNNASNIG